MTVFVAVAMIMIVHRESNIMTVLHENQGE